MMVTEEGPRVVEFNSRFGDPEAEVLLPRLRTDLLAVCEAVAENRLSELEVGVGRAGHRRRGDGRARLSRRLPARRRDRRHRRRRSRGPRLLRGRRAHRGRVVTAGGRVLCVVAAGDHLAEARALAYDNVARIRFEGAHYRATSRSTRGAATRRERRPGRGRPSRGARCASAAAPSRSTCCRRSRIRPPGRPASTSSRPGGRRGRASLAEEALAALEGNREFVIRNLRARDVRPQALAARRSELEAACRRLRARRRRRGVPPPPRWTYHRTAPPRGARSSGTPTSATRSPASSRGCC